MWIKKEVILFKEWILKRKMLNYVYTNCDWCWGSLDELEDFTLFWR